MRFGPLLFGCVFGRTFDSTFGPFLSTFAIPRLGAVRYLPAHHITHPGLVDAVKSLVRVPAKGPVEVKHTTWGGFPSWVKVRKTRKVLNEVLYAPGSQVPEKGSVTPQCTWGRSLQRRGTRRLSPFPGERPLRAALSRTRTAMYWSRCDERVANGSWTDLRSMILGARDSHPQAKKHLLVAWLLGLVESASNPVGLVICPLR
jgi:hypothetical protein